MNYSFSRNSKRELGTVDNRLAAVVRQALTISAVDFTVLDGLRTASEQFSLWKAGASRLNGVPAGETIERPGQSPVSGTGVSRHQANENGFSEAVDLVPWHNGQLRWEHDLCDAVARAMQSASQELGVCLRWGSVWDRNMDSYGDPGDARLDYIKRRVHAAKRVFLDGPHFELAT